MVLLTVSCSRSDPPPSLDSGIGNTLRFDVFNPFVSFNPAHTSPTGASWIFPMVFSYLAVQTPKGRLEPDLARNWEYDPKNYSWRIRLRKDARFHDGSPVTAADVIFTYKTLLASIRPHLFDQILRMEALSDDILKVTLKQDNPEFIAQIFDMEILPHKLDLSVQHGHPIGSGPYRFEKNIGGHTVRLVAYDGYHGGRPKIDRAEFKFVPDFELSWSRLLAGRTDIAVRISPRNYRMMKYIRHKYRIGQTLSPFYWIMLFNTTDPLFEDHRVRRALSLGIDRQEMVSSILHGYGSVATGPLGVDSPFSQRNGIPLPYAPLKGQELLETAGWQIDPESGIRYRNGKPLAFTLLYPLENPVEARVARFIQYSLHELGVKVTIKAARHERIKTAYYRNSQFQAVLNESNGAYHSGSPFISVWESGTGKCSQPGCFKDRDLTRLVDAVIASNDDETTRDLFHKIESLMLDLSPAAFLFQKTDIDVVANRIQIPYPFMAHLYSMHQLYRASIQPEP